MLDLENLVALIPIIHLSKLRSVRLKGSSVYCLWKKKPSKSRLGQHDLLLWVIWSRLIWHSQTFLREICQESGLCLRSKMCACNLNFETHTHTYLPHPPPILAPFLPPLPYSSPALPYSAPIFCGTSCGPRGGGREGPTLSLGGTNLAPPGFSHHTTSRNFPD